MFHFASQARRKERREFVDTVRALAAHVRQKDVRWAKAQAEAAAKTAEKEQAAARRQKEAKAAKLAQAMAVEEAAWYVVMLRFGPRVVEVQLRTDGSNAPLPIVPPKGGGAPSQQSKARL
jgi:hypothetical protein